MEKRKKNTREDYLKKWEKLMETFNFIPQAGEEIVQCKEPYPAYWFVSNKGYVLSVWGNGIKYIAPVIKRTGAKNKNGERPGRDWYYNYFNKIVIRNQSPVTKSDCHGNRFKQR